ncbi:MBOAT-2 domain-containing protein [Mycena indigotica]|uniref:MBOAT-2 domain-containing protein n=1 Tax=Mycena indigotica TaxID=2126181 RepID=A0A8H6TGQ8_9AGAR|nr:MBOAT-2 domain-containing protein [Mycena indigotica]KAF7316447.1 MBOAT-2 domain-containing protein [Mycena indigotica]
MALDPLFTFSDAQWALYLVLMQLPLILQPSQYRPLFFVPILALTVYTAFSTKGRFLDDYYNSLQWMTYFFFASDYILMTDVQRELRQVPGDADTKNGIENASLWRRFCWANSLFFSPRGVGWAHEPTDSLPPHPPLNISRTRFVLQRLRSAVVFFLIHDLCNLHVRANPMFYPEGPGWRSDGWLWRYIVTVSWALSASTALCLIFSLLSVLAVVTRFSEPQAWPALMGRPGDAYTIRRFWGRTWHQLMRRFVSSHGRRLVQFLGLRRGKNPSAYTQLFVAFFISGVVHYAAEVIAMRNYAGMAMIFFMLQPCGIMLEDFVIWCGRRAGWESDKWNYVGYFTTLTWFALVGPLWQETLVREGQMTEGLPVSVIMGVWKGQWVHGPFPTLH